MTDNHRPYGDVVFSTGCETDYSFTPSGQVRFSTSNTSDWPDPNEARLDAVARIYHDQIELGQVTFRLVVAHGRGDALEPIVVPVHIAGTVTRALVSVGPFGTVELPGAYGYPVSPGDTVTLQAGERGLFQIHDDMAPATPRQVARHAPPARRAPLPTREDLPRRRAIDLSGFTLR